MELSPGHARRPLEMLRHAYAVTPMQRRCSRGAMTQMDAASCNLCLTSYIGTQYGRIRIAIQEEAGIIGPF